MRWNSPIGQEWSQVKCGIRRPCNDTNVGPVYTSSPFTVLHKRGVWNTPICGTFPRCGRCAINVNFRYGAGLQLYQDQGLAPGGCLRDEPPGMNPASQQMQLRLLTTADIHPAGAALPADIEARRAAAAETPAAYTLGYCRACRIFLLEILQQHHLTEHTEEELRRQQHPCFRCETLLPAGDPFQLVCADCAGKPREDLETQTAVMTAIAAEMDEPAEGMAAHLQAQIDHVHQFLQKVNAEKAEEPEEEENGGG